MRRILYVGLAILVAGGFALYAYQANIDSRSGNAPRVQTESKPDKTGVSDDAMRNLKLR